jgi:hypothetical protein
VEQRVPERKMLISGEEREIEEEKRKREKKKRKKKKVSNSIEKYKKKKRKEEQKQNSPRHHGAPHSRRVWLKIRIVQNQEYKIAKSNRYKNKLLVSSHINKNNNRPKSGQTHLSVHIRFSSLRVVMSVSTKEWMERARLEPLTESRRY